jgi:hypothetical protein
MPKQIDIYKKEVEKSMQEVRSSQPVSHLNTLIILIVILFGVSVAADTVETIHSIRPTLA